MDSFFGIGFPELVFILILAGLVLGPHRIRHVARTLGKFVAQMQAISQEFTRQLNAELDAMDSDEMRGAVDDMKALRREVDDLRRQVKSIPQELAQEGKKAVEEGERAFKPVSRPAPEQNNDADSETPDQTLPSGPTPDALPNPIDVPDDPQ
jgi:sec-independent protein translocase protein TatB